jgi:hypothetical protein
MRRAFRSTRTGRRQSVLETPETPGVDAPTTDDPAPDVGDGDEGDGDEGDGGSEETSL